MNSDKQLGPTGRGDSPHVRLRGPWSFRNSGLISAMIYSAEQISAARGEEEKHKNQQASTIQAAHRCLYWLCGHHVETTRALCTRVPTEGQKQKCEADKGESPQPRPSTRNSVRNVRSETHALVSGIPKGAVRKRSQGGLP